jgi:hypothetical protein
LTRGLSIKSKKVDEGNYSKDAMELNPDFTKVGQKPGVMGKIAQGVKKVADFVAPGDEDLMRDLERKSGGRRPTKEAAAPVDFDKVLDAIAALYGDDIWENDAMQDLANDLEHQAQLIGNWILSLQKASCPSDWPTHNSQQATMFDLVTLQHPRVPNTKALLH